MHFAPLMLHQAVCVRTDNQVVRSYINRQGGMGPESLFLLSRRIGVAERHLLSLSAVYLPGRENEPGDSLSRHFPSSVALCLSPALFEVIIQRFGPPWLDLFTTEENTLLPNFCSLVPSRIAWARDALSVSWPPACCMHFLRSS